jgi:hypothetical protein
MLPLDAESSGDQPDTLKGFIFEHLVEMYLVIGFKYLYFDPSVTRDIWVVDDEHRLVSEEKRKYPQVFMFRNYPTSAGFFIDSFDFSVLLKAMSPTGLIAVLSAILLERKVILVKTDISDSALLIQGLLRLLRPFEWHFTLITYLTLDMADYLDAPVPFLIGVSQKTWAQISITNEISEEIFVFDIEGQLQIHGDPRTELPFE